MRRTGVVTAIVTVFAMANTVTTRADQPSVPTRTVKSSHNLAKSRAGIRQDQPLSFADWIATLKAEAKGRRIGERTLAAALDGLRLNRRALALEKHQPEFVTPVGAYVAALTKKEALQAGRKKRKQHAALLGRIEKAYGVPPRYILAIWRLESDYGGNYGSFPVV